MRRHRLAAVAFAAALASATAAQQTMSTPSVDPEFGEKVRAYLLQNPEVLIEALDILEARRRDQQAQADADLIASQADELYNDGASHVFGDPDGDVTIVEFADYRCGYCKAAHPQVAELLESDGDIRLILKEFPILGPESTLAARAALAGRRIDPERYADYHDAMMGWRGALDEDAIFALAKRVGYDEAALREEMEDPAIAEHIRDTYALARALGVEGTPSFVIGDRVVRGFVQIDQMRELVAEARAEQG